MWYRVLFEKWTKVTTANELTPGDCRDTSSVKGPTPPNSASSTSSGTASSAAYSASKSTAGSSSSFASSTVKYARAFLSKVLGNLPMSGLYIIS
jgi:hypothetical protein